MTFIGAPLLSRTEVRPGLASLTATADGDVTHLADLGQAAPLRLLFPRVPADEPLTAFLVNTAGGLVGGDAHEVRIRAETGARVLIAASSAEKVYRSAGATARVEIDLAAGSGAWLEYLPQETILFEGARFARRTRLEIDPDARALVGEMLVFGRAARGETLTRGLIRDATEVWSEGRLLWADALHMKDDLRAPLEHEAAFAGAHATALLVLVAPAPLGYRDALRELPLPDGVRFGATVVNRLLIARWLASDALAMRRHYAAAWKLLRTRAAALAPRLPPLWQI